MKSDFSMRDKNDYYWKHPYDDLNTKEKQNQTETSARMRAIIGWGNENIKYRTLLERKDSKKFRNGERILIYINLILDFIKN